MSSNKESKYPDFIVKLSLAALCLLTTVFPKVLFADETSPWHISLRPDIIAGDEQVKGPGVSAERAFPSYAGGARRCDGTMGWHLPAMPSGVFFLDTRATIDQHKSVDRPGIMDDFSRQQKTHGSLDMGCGQGAVCAVVPALNFMQQEGATYKLAEPRYVNNLYTFDDPYGQIDGKPPINAIRVTWPDEKLTDEWFYFQEVDGQRYFFSDRGHAYIQYDAVGCKLSLHTRYDEMEFEPGPEDPDIYPKYTWFPQVIKEFNGTDNPRKIEIDYINKERPVSAKAEGEILWHLTWDKENHISSVAGPGNSYSFDLIYQKSKHDRKQLVAQVFKDKPFAFRYGYSRFGRLASMQLWGKDSGGGPQGPPTFALGFEHDKNGMATKIRSHYRDEETSIVFDGEKFSFRTKSGGRDLAYESSLKCNDESVQQITTSIDGQPISRTDLEWNKILDAVTISKNLSPSSEAEVSMTLDPTAYPSSVFPRANVQRLGLSDIQSSVHGGKVSDTRYGLFDNWGQPKQFFHQGKLVAEADYDDAGQLSTIRWRSLGSEVPSLTEEYAYVTPPGYAQLPLWKRKIRPVANIKATTSNGSYSNLAVTWDPQKPWRAKKFTMTGTFVAGEHTVQTDHSGGDIHFRKLIQENIGVPLPPIDVSMNPRSIKTKVGSSDKTRVEVSLDGLSGQLLNASTGLGDTLSVQRAGRLELAQGVTINHAPGKEGSLTTKTEHPRDEWGKPISKDLVTVTDSASATHRAGLENLVLDLAPNSSNIPLTLEPPSPEKPDICLAKEEWLKLPERERETTPYWEEAGLFQSPLSWCDKWTSYQLTLQDHIEGEECVVGEVMNMRWSERQKHDAFGWLWKYPISVDCVADKVCALDNGHNLIRAKKLEGYHFRTGRPSFGTGSDYYCTSERCWNGYSNYDCREGSHFNAFIHEGKLLTKSGTCNLPGQDPNRNATETWQLWPVTEQEIYQPWNETRCVFDEYRSWDTERVDKCVGPSAYEDHHQRMCEWYPTDYMNGCQDTLQCGKLERPRLCEPPPLGSQPPGGGCDPGAAMCIP